MTAGQEKSIADAIGGSTKETLDRYVVHGNDITCIKDVVNFINNNKNTWIKAYLLEKGHFKGRKIIIG